MADMIGLKRVLNVSRMFLKQAASHFIKKNLTTVFNFLGKITPFQRENDQYYVYKHDVNLISVPIMAHKHCQNLPVITKGP